MNFFRLNEAIFAQCDQPQNPCAMLENALGIQPTLDSQTYAGTIKPHTEMTKSLSEHCSLSLKVCHLLEQPHHRKD